MYTSPQSWMRSHKVQPGEPVSFPWGYSQDCGSGVTYRNRDDWKMAVTPAWAMTQDSFMPGSPKGLQTRLLSRSEKWPLLCSTAQPHLEFVFSSIEPRRCLVNLASFSFLGCV